MLQDHEFQKFQLHMKRQQQLELLRQTQNNNTRSLRWMLIILIALCTFIHLLLTPSTYSLLNQEYLKDFPQHSVAEWRVLWIVTWTIKTTALVVAFVGVITQRLAFLAIALVTLLFGMMSCNSEFEQDNPTLQQVWNFNLISLSLICVLIVIYVARLRAFSEERLYLIGRPGGSFFIDESPVLISASGRQSNV